MTLLFRPPEIHENKVMWLTDLLFTGQDYSSQIKKKNFMLICSLLSRSSLSGVKGVYSIIHVFGKNYHAAYP